MKYNILGIVVLVAVLSVSIQAHLIWPSIALGVLLLWLCASLYGRMSRMLYAYRETEKENEKLHTRLAEAERQLQYLRQLTENVDTALFVCTTDGRIDWMNHAAAPSNLPQLGEAPFSEHHSATGGCVKIGTSSFFYRKAPTFSSQGFVMSKIFCTFGPSF